MGVRVSCCKVIKFNLKVQLYKTVLVGAIELVTEDAIASNWERHKRDGFISSRNKFTSLLHHQLSQKHGP